jgi:hypothetical protein
VVPAANNKAAASAAQSGFLTAESPFFKQPERVV